MRSAHRAVLFLVLSQRSRAHAGALVSDQRFTFSIPPYIRADRHAAGRESPQQMAAALSMPVARLACTAARACPEPSTLSRPRLPWHVSSKPNHPKTRITKSAPIVTRLRTASGSTRRCSKQTYCGVMTSSRVRPPSIPCATQSLQYFSTDLRRPAQTTAPGVVCSSSSFNAKQ